MTIKDQLIDLLSSGWMSLEEIAKELNYQRKNDDKINNYSYLIKI